jgi:hypothetical protein
MKRIPKSKLIQLMKNLIVPKKRKRTQKKIKHQTLKIKLENQKVRFKLI